MRTSWKKRLLVFAMLAALLAAHAGSFAVLEVYPNHHHTGEHCVICLLTEQAVQTLLTQCGDLPPALLSLYFPRQYTKYRNGQLGSDLRAVILDRIGDVLDDYAAACFPALYE